MNVPLLEFEESLRAPRDWRESPIVTGSVDAILAIGGTSQQGVLDKTDDWMDIP